MDDDFNPFEESDFRWEQEWRRKNRAMAKDEAEYRAHLAALAAAEEEEAHRG